MGAVSGVKRVPLWTYPATPSGPQNGPQCAFSGAGGQPCHGQEKTARRRSGFDLVVDGGSVHRHVTSGHQVHGQAHSAAQPVALASGYAVRAGEVVTLGCAI